MSHAGRLTGLGLRAGLRKVLEPRPGLAFQLASYLLVLALFLVGGYALFFKVFRYLAVLEDIGAPILSRLLSTAFLTFSLMLLLSNLVTALSTLYQSREIDFLLTTPIGGGQLFRYRFYQNLFYSTWATLLLGLPLVLALRAALGGSWLRLAADLALLAPFVLIPAFLGVLVLMAAIRLFPKLSLRQLMGVLFLALGLASWLFFAFGQPQGLSVGDIQNLPQLDRYLSRIALPASPLLPSSWITEALVFRGPSWPGYVLARLWMLAITAAFLGAACLLAADRHYYRSLLVRVTDAGGGAVRGALMRSGFARRFPIAAKDVVLFFRNPVQWTQGLIFLSLLVIYVGSLRRYPLLFSFPAWRVAVSFINLAFTGYILATLSVRFVFPTVSLEGPMLWLVKSVPLRSGRLFWEKSVLSILTNVILAVTLSLVSNWLLKTLPQMNAFASAALLLICLAVTSITLGLGAVWPDYKERNPGRIASGLGGLLTALISLVYVGLSIVILAWPVYLYAASLWRGRLPYGHALLISFLALLLLSAMAMYFPLHYGLRALERVEV